MNTSDYGYASSSCYKTINLDQYNNKTCINSNWIRKMTGSVSSYLMNPWHYCCGAYDVNHIQINGAIWATGAGKLNAHPVVYYKSSVLFAGGEGTSSNPYIIIKNI